MGRAWVERPSFPRDARAIERIDVCFPIPHTPQHTGGTTQAERRAAINLHVFTGGTPTRIDDGSRNGAVDLALAFPNGETAVVEVTSSVDEQTQQAFVISNTFVGEIHRQYEGSAHWLLHFKRGFDIPLRSDAMQVLARAVSDELRSLDNSDTDYVALNSAPWLGAHRSRIGGNGVEGASWDARAPHADHAYNRHLRDFLTSNLVERKRQKLVRERRRLKAPRAHLYVLATPTGIHAGVVPHGPWDLAGENTPLPEGIDVLWLDTLGRFTYRVAPGEVVTVFENR